MAIKKSIPTPIDRIRYIFILLLFIFIVGIVGFHFIEGWGFLDSFFMTLITITTIGYREIRPLSDAGKIFDVLIILMGVGTTAYGFASMAQFIVEGELQKTLGRKRLDKKILSMQKHYIICGNGRIGSLIWKDLEKASKPFVVIESDQETTLQLEEDHIPHILGNATKEETLIAAGIKRAKGLIATASSDMNNVYITLIAKELNPEIFVLARAATEESIKNIKRAGADKVVSPYLIGGRHMSNIILKPTVVDFINLAAGDKTDDLHIYMEGFEIKAESCLNGKTLKDSPIKKNIGLTVVAIKEAHGEMVFNPQADYTIGEKDVLVCIGKPEALKAMKDLARPS